MHKSLILFALLLSFSSFVSARHQHPVKKNHKHIGDIELGLNVGRSKPSLSANNPSTSSVENGTFLDFVADLSITKHKFPVYPYVAMHIGGHWFTANTSGPRSGYKPHTEWIIIGGPSFFGGLRGELSLGGNTFLRGNIGLGYMHELYTFNDFSSHIAYEAGVDLSANRVVVIGLRYLQPFHSYMGSGGAGEFLTDYKIRHIMLTLKLCFNHFRG